MAQFGNRRSKQYSFTIAIFFKDLSFRESFYMWCSLSWSRQ